VIFPNERFPPPSTPLFFVVSLFRFGTASFPYGQSFTRVGPFPCPSLLKRHICLNFDLFSGSAGHAINMRPQIPFPFPFFTIDAFPMSPSPVPLCSPTKPMRIFFLRSLTSKRRSRPQKPRAKRYLVPSLPFRY